MLTLGPPIISSDNLSILSSGNPSIVSSDAPVLSGLRVQGGVCSQGERVNSSRGDLGLRLRE